MTDERFSIRVLEEADRGPWEEFVKGSNDGTIFHTLAFLSYHGERFRAGEHHLVVEKGGRIHAVMPCAITDEDGRKVARSPYGASYGGPVSAEPLNYEDSHAVIALIQGHLASLGVTEIRLTLPPRTCSRSHSDTFRLALMERGFACTNRDIESVVCLDSGLPEHAEWQRRRSRIERKARKAASGGIEILADADVEDFWQVLGVTFHKLGITPTHSKEELRLLCSTMGGKVSADIAALGGKPVAGIGHFVLNERSICSFYLCQDPEHQHLQGMSALILHALDQARDRGFSWYTFGTSSLGMQGNPSLFRFKESFGSVGVFRETYQHTTSRGNS